ncbi:MAG: DUF480 domain-containing protein [Gammaproteobacteria bacterium]|nr:DUF480 domain-containing protein [Gammaproteobacteria bacterium]MDX2461741.1 DUF480 domain-containing protein [Gammaproteobacteria bacterium]
MDTILSPLELRLLGCLIEKESTTPDGYPLSLNALTAACNQKTNRDPLMDLNEHTVLDTVEALIKKSLVTSRGGAGSRVSKFAHRLSNRLLDENQYSRPELALLCVLFLRGPQTLGELKTRCARIHTFPDTAELLATLKMLEQRDGGACVVKLPTQPGQKEARYAHLLGGEVEAESAPTRGATTATVSDGSARIAELELEVGSIRRELDALRARFDSFTEQ